MSRKTCADCCHYDRDYDLCRRNPPVDVHGIQAGRWPTVSSADWCGELERRINQYADAIRKHTDD